MSQRTSVNSRWPRYQGLFAFCLDVYKYFINSKLEAIHDARSELDTLHGIHSVRSAVDFSAGLPKFQCHLPASSFRTRIERSFYPTGLDQKRGSVRVKSELQRREPATYFKEEVENRQIP